MCLLLAICGLERARSLCGADERQHLRAPAIVRVFIHNVLTSQDEDILLGCSLSLLNLSTDAAVQSYLGRHALDVFFELSRRDDFPQLAMIGAEALSNLAQCNVRIACP